MASEIAGFAWIGLEFLWEHRLGVAAGIVAIIGLNSLRVIAWNTAAIANELSQITEALKRLADKLPNSN